MSSAEPVAAQPRDMHALQSLQILRAVAALGVLTHHSLIEKWVLFGGEPAPLNNFVIGAAGVDLFFVISGFVMVYASEFLFGRRDAPRVFFLRRLARIVPLYWAVTAAILIYLLVVHGAAVVTGLYSTASLIASFMFYPYPNLYGVYSPVHTLGWTLNYEMFFYAVFAIAIVLPRRAAVIAVTALFVILVAIGRVVALPQPFAFWFDPIILEFCFGMAIALAWRAGMRIPVAMSWVLVLGAIAAFAAAAAGLQAGGQWRALVWGVPSAAIVAAFALSRETARPRAIGRAFGFLGDASYSLYLVHSLVFPIVRWTLPRWIDFSPYPWAYVVIAFVAAIAGAIGSYLLFERPVTRWLQCRIGPLMASFRPQPENSSS